jgi:hypothetical protein
MKKLFLLLIVNCSFLIGTASAQWWVRGGNLLWPYGDVVIQKDLEVEGEVTFDSSTVIDGKLAVDTLVEGGVKEYIARINWNMNSDPTVTELKNTTGATFTWDNQDDLGENLDITASTSVFDTDKTSFYNGLANSGAVNYFVYGFAMDTNHYRLMGVDASGGTQPVANVVFIVEIKIYP